MADAGARADRKLIVFISYSRADVAFAEAIVDALKTRDFDVLIDRRDLPYGEEWKPELLDFVRQSDAVVFVVSAHSVGSRWCKWELERKELHRLSDCRINSSSILSLWPLLIAFLLPRGLRFDRTPSRCGGRWFALDPVEKKEKERPAAISVADFDFIISLSVGANVGRNANG
jgi:hypothetical protein